MLAFVNGGRRRTGLATARAGSRRLLAALDGVSPRVAAAGGAVVAGAAGGALVAAAPPEVAAVGLGVLAAGAAALAWRGEPVLVVPPEPVAAEPGPPDTHGIVGPPPVVPEPPAPVGAVVPLLDLVEIRGGTSWMGSREGDRYSQDDERPRHRVTVSPFRLGRTPVTVAQWREVMPEHPAGAGDEDDLPVVEVSWRDAIDFCNRLSARESLAECYTRTGEGAGDVVWHEERDAYRLPTEAEWEHAARAGTESTWFFGEDETKLSEYAWYASNAKNHRRLVGKLAASPWGLHDIYGNVWEWCWDWYGPYDGAMQIDPAGPPEGDRRLVRGGAFWNDPRYVRSACRNRDHPEGRDLDLGFRCALGVPGRGPSRGPEPGRRVPVCARPPPPAAP
jgi:formylglycine-generating enzyme required for sulfatase activity